MAQEPERYIVTNGKMVLVLEPDEDGWYTVTSPYDSALITCAKTIPEAFEMAQDAAHTLEESRAKMAKVPARKKA
jgi:hypothetical protein